MLLKASTMSLLYPTHFVALRAVASLKADAVSVAGIPVLSAIHRDFLSKIKFRYALPT